jgi:hypothetical protein
MRPRSFGTISRYGIVARTPKGRLLVNALRRRSRIAIVALGLTGLVAAASQIATASPFDSAAVVNAAVNAISNQYVVAQEPGSSAMVSLFTGSALMAMGAPRDAIQSNIAKGQDYPGRIDVSNVKVLNIQGTADAVTLDVSEHEKTANMRAGHVVDYSESDIINHMTLVRVNGNWIVSSMDWRFAPGSEP